MAEPGDTRRAGRGSLLLFAAAMTLCTAQALWAIAHIDRFPLNDGPQHLFLGHLETVYADPASGYRQYIEPGTPLSSRGFTTLFEPLDRLLGWRAALRVTLMTGVVIWVLGFLFLVVSIDPRRLWLALLAPATAVQWSLYLGLWSYFVATGFGFVVVAWAVRSRQLTVARALVLAALLLTQAMMHAFAAELTGLVVVAVVASRPRPLRSLAIVVAAGMPAAAIAVASAPATVASAASHDDYPPTTWLPALEQVRVFIASLATGPVWRGLPAVLLCLAGIAASFRPGAAAERRLGRGLALVALLLVVTGLVSPFHLSFWQLFSLRFGPVAIMVGAACLPLERLERRAAIAAVALALAGYSVASNLWARSTNDGLERAAADAMSGLDAPIARTGPRLPIIIDRNLTFADPSPPWASIPSFAPAMNLGHVYCVQQGGMPPYNFMGTPTLHNFVHREYFPMVYPPVPSYMEWFVLAPGPTYPDPATRAAILTAVTRHGRPYDDVIIYGAPADAEPFLEHGYAEDWRRGGLFVGHYVGCTGALEVRGAVEGAEALTVEYGMFPLELVDWQTTVALEPGASEGEPLVVPLERAPCGRLWFRVAWVRDAATRDIVFCQGATPAGILPITMRPGERIVCTPAGSQEAPEEGARTIL